MKTLNRIVKVMLVLTSVIVISFAACACAAEGEAKENAGYALVVGVHSNEKTIPFNSNTVQEVLSDITYRHAEVTFINCDADPEPYFQTRVPEPSVKNLSKDKLKRIADNYIKELTQIIGEAKPDSAEFDTLKAIQKAAQSIKDLDDKKYDKDILIMDSGLSTTGYMDFTKGLLYAEPENVVAALKEVSAIPDLDGVDVSWAFLGDVAAPQQALTVDEKENLKNIWNAVLTEAGAKSVTFRNDFSSSEAYQDLPLVSTVDVGEEEIEIAGSRESRPPVIEIGNSESGTPSALDPSKVSFVGDKDIFVDKKAAKEAIAQVADLMRQYPDNRIYIVGTTATGRDDTAFCQDLSERRARAVADVLIEMGIEEDRLIPIGLGYEDPWHIDDIGSDGHQIEELAAQNRKVLIIDENSQEASLLQ